MASNYHLALLFFFFFFLFLSPCTATTRKLTALVQDPPLVLKYHKGPLLKGNVTVNIVWYGNFSPKQRSILVDFLHSLSSRPSQHSVASWWQTTSRYTGGPCTVVVGNQFLDNTYSLGKTLTDAKLAALAKLGSKRRRNSKSVTTIDVILTGADVAMDGFCMSRCGSHGSGRGGSAYLWVGNPVTQCPGQCAWPFYRPIYGPQSPPLVSPNGDVGIDGMVINLATVLAGTVTNPFGNGYFQGEGGYEAVSACTGIFGNGAYPGYPGEVVVDKTTGASYNAVGVRGRKYLLPAMWDPKTSVCKTVG